MLAKVIAVRVGFLALTLGLWQLASTALWIDPDLLPGPASIVLKLRDLLGNDVFLGHAGTTLVRVVAAFAIGAPLAVLTGFVIAERKFLRERFAPAVYFLMGVPQSIFMPVFIQIFGVGALQKVVFGITHLYFALVTVTIGAVLSTSPQLVLAARSFGASRARIYRSVYVRAMLPTLINGLRLALIFDILGILAAEMFASRSGLGQLIMAWGEEYRAAEMMAAVLLISIVTVALNETMALIQRRFAPENEAGAIQGATA